MRRYTIVLADRRTGVVRRFTVPFWPALGTVAGVLALPVLIGTGAALKASGEISGLYATASALEIENANYRVATEALPRSKIGIETPSPIDPPWR